MRNPPCPVHAQGRGCQKRVGGGGKECLLSIYYVLSPRLRALLSCNFPNSLVSVGMLFLFTEEEGEAQGRKTNDQYWRS